MSGTESAERDGRAELLRLLEKNLGDEITHREFCAAVESFYNFRLKQKDFSPEELAAIEALFDEVVWYSPYPEERKEVPHYKGEDEIEAALSRARQALGLQASA